jgi:hypothetical protein
LSDVLTLNDPFTQILFAAAIIMMIGYGVGRFVNRRRSKQISRWLEPGLRSLGGTPVAQKVDRTSFRFKVLQAAKPFATVTTSAVLISREVLPTWLWEKVKGHSDVLLIHVTFRQLPTLEADVLDLSNELGRRGQDQVSALGWPEVGQIDHWHLYVPDESQRAAVERLAKVISGGEFNPWRVAVRRGAPHMLISMPMPDFGSVQSADLVKWLKKIARVVHAGE